MGVSEDHALISAESPSEVQSKMFEPDRFIAECQAAKAAGPDAVREVVAEAVADPRKVLKGLGEPTRAGLHSLFRSPELTILNVVWGPGMNQLPHNHQMWAVIGIYSGREDNIFWRRIPGNPDKKIESAGAKVVCDGDVLPLGQDIIHSVLNPLERMTGAIHVYGGDFFGVPRSQWDPERLTEQPFDVDRALALFAASNLGRNASGPDPRPRTWVGHVTLETNRIEDSARFMREMGMRPIFEGPEMAIFELRGGTHLILFARSAVHPGNAKFDLMVDDLRGAHQRLTTLGFDPSPIEAVPNIDHERFQVREPAGNLITFFSSHASGPV
jgi:predicted metal-dependent enzyme (double-stranded beta helix superfamily)/catechol 2,3-dioxygenase-like lactoylglutathione lyase family enzyme